MVMVTLNIPLGPALTEEQARDIFAAGEEAVVFALLRLAKLAAEAKPANPASDSNSPAAPSGMKPTHLKPNASHKGKKRKKPGRKKGHAGARRGKPARTDAREEHRADGCPDCGGPLNRCQET